VDVSDDLENLIAQGELLRSDRGDASITHDEWFRRYRRLERSGALRVAEGERANQLAIELTASGIARQLKAESKSSSPNKGVAA